MIEHREHVPEAPAWQDDPRECLRRLPSFQALELCGALTREQREAGDLFAMRYSLALMHCPATVGAYGERTGGGEVPDEVHHAARVWVRCAVKRAGPAAKLLIMLARDERPLLTEAGVALLRQGLDRLRHG